MLYKYAVTAVDSSKQPRCRRDIGVGISRTPRLRLKGFEYFVPAMATEYSITRMILGYSAEFTYSVGISKH